MTETFALAPVSSRTQLLSWMIGIPLVTLMLGVLLVMTVIFFNIPRITFTLSDQDLTVSYPFYGRSIPLDQLQIEQARIVNLNQEPNLKPAWRTNGVGLPGFGGGWFKLKNKQKALLFLSQQEQAIYLPTHEGFVLLFSPQEPRRFLERLKQSRAS